MTPTNATVNQDVSTDRLEPAGKTAPLSYVKFPESAALDGYGQPENDETANAVRQQLAKTLDSDTFRQSKRLCAFLEFSVNETLAGRYKSITAPTIAIEVFNKGQELDLKSEGLVRVQARQLRLKLSSYYEGEGRDDPIHISVPLGGYSAAFERKNTGDSARSQTERDDDLKPPNGVAIFVTAIDCQCDERLATEIASAIPHDIATAMAPFSDFEVCDVSYSRYASKTIRPPSLILNGNLTWENSIGNLTVALQETRTHEIIWTRQYDIDGWDARLTIARRVAVAVVSPSGAIAARRAHALKKDATDADEATALVFQANHYSSRPNLAEFKRLRAALDEFMSSEDVIHARVWAAASMLSLDAARFRFDPDADYKEQLEKSLHAARKAVSLGPDCSYCWCMLSGVYYELRDFARSEATAKSALELNANNTDAMMLVGMHTWNRGKIEEGLKLIDDAFDLNTQPPSWYYISRVHEALRNGDFSQALRAVASIEMGEFFWPSLLETAIYGHLKDADGYDRAYRRTKSRAPWVLEGLPDILEAAPFPDEFKANLLTGIQADLAPDPD